MKPVDFKGRNVIYAKDQPQYLPLPALQLRDNDGTVYTCWELSDEEIKTIIENRCFYIKQLTFNQPLQPIRPISDLDDGISFIPQSVA